MANFNLNLVERDAVLTQTNRTCPSNSFFLHFFWIIHVRYINKIDSGRSKFTEISLLNNGGDNRGD